MLQHACLGAACGRPDEPGCRAQSHASIPHPHLLADDGASVVVGIADVQCTPPAARECR
jgi:hypothetical protein